VLLYLGKGARENSRDAARLHPLSPTLAEFTNAIALRGGWLRAAEAVIFEQTTPEQETTVRAQYDKKRAGRIFQELWAGDLCPRVYGYAPTINLGPGAVRRDRPLLDVSLLPGENVSLAALTGRTLSEAQLALEMVGLDARIALPGPRGITRDDGFFKPEPFGMRALLARLDARVALYVGDALDDLRTVLAYRTLPEAQQTTLLRPRC
jgi:phosphoglycolate phosphatase-like HAD superfamily hydrolase